MTWPVGADVIRRLLDDKELESVQPNATHATTVIAQAARHLQSARTTRADDLEGAYELAYSGYHKVADALLAEQGLRATTKGGHVALLDAVKAQFNGKSGSPAFANPSVYRRLRHDATYPDPSKPSITSEDLDDMLRILELALDAAARIRGSGALTVFR